RSVEADVGMPGAEPGIEGGGGGGSQAGARMILCCHHPGAWAKGLRSGPMPSLAERFPRRRAFVTGGGSGLGRAVALRLAREGWTLGVQDVSGPAADETLGLVQAAGGRGRTFVYDVSKA